MKLKNTAKDCFQWLLNFLAQLTLSQHYDIDIIMI